MRIAIADPSMYEKVSAYCGLERGGCYRLFVQHEAPVPIDRLLGRDPAGTLYIGASLRLPDRLASLKKSILAAHGEGYLTRYIHPAGRKLTDQVMRLFGGPFAYHVEVFKQALSPEVTDRAHFREEDRMLRDYHGRWGEYPPLNG